MRSLRSLTKAEKRLIDIIKPFIVSEETLNTNNGWGFGGAIKTVYRLNKDNITLHIGYACYRHLPSENFINLRRNNVIIHEGIRNVVKYFRDTYHINI